MSKLFAQLRKAPSLSVLDAQIYPSWTDLVKPSETPGHEEPATPFERRTRLPTKENFRQLLLFLPGADPADGGRLSRPSSSTGLWIIRTTAAG